MGGFDAYIVKLNSSGTVLSSQSFGSANDDQAFQLAIGGPNKALYAAGNYGAAVNFGNAGLAGPGGSYVVRFATSTPVTKSKSPSDFDGTGKTQVATYNPSNGEWYVKGTTGDRLLGTFGTHVDIIPKSGGGTTAVRVLEIPVVATTCARAGPRWPLTTL